MTIEISSAEILYRVRDVAQDELAVSVPDETLRYKIEPGSEKEDKVKSFIAQAVEDLCSRVWRFLSDKSHQDYAMIDNAAETLPERYVFEFEISERRAFGKANMLANKFISYAVEYALMNYYLTIGQVALSQNHAQLAALDQNKISNLLYTKALP